MQNFYNEELELTRYVWNNYIALLNEVERYVNNAAIGRDKAAHASSPQLAQVLRQRLENRPDLDLDEILAEGIEQFRRRAAARVLGEHGWEIHLNRCPQCERLVRTPLAKQCLWCNHDWHERHP